MSVSFPPVSGATMSASNPLFWADLFCQCGCGSATMCSNPARAGELGSFSIGWLADTHKQDADYPEWCPHCGAAAYIGLNKVDCKAQCKTASSPYL